MTQRTILLIAAGLTAFVLVLLGGLATYLTQPAAPPVFAVAAGEPGPAGPAALAPEREAAYQQALREAQARLEEANYRLAQAATPPAAGPTAAPTAAPTAPPAPTYAVSADQAVQTALGSAPGAVLVDSPELVRYQDRVAYEVLLDRGPVYVDATSGQVLYNGAAAGGPGAPAQTTPTDDPEDADGAGDRNEPDDAEDADDRNEPDDAEDADDRNEPDDAEDADDLNEPGDDDAGGDD
jgi:uncharacterized membrane protein YkoI